MGTIAQNGQARLAEDVVRELLNQLQVCVTTYPEGVERTGATLDDLIDGTAFFPGGAGLWRGDEYGGSLPEDFPVRPVMLIAHNFGGKSGYYNAKTQGGEAQSHFWSTLKSFLIFAGVDLSDCFYTNALMGLKPGSTSGSMPQSKLYDEQCRAFLARQVQVVNPRVLITLGNKSKDELCAAMKRFPELGGFAVAHIMHPSTWPKDQKPDRQRWIDLQAAKIRAVASGQ